MQELNEGKVRFEGNGYITDWLDPRIPGDAAIIEYRLRVMEYMARDPEESAAKAAEHFPPAHHGASYPASLRGLQRASPTRLGLPLPCGR